MMMVIVLKFCDTLILIQYNHINPEAVKWLVSAFLGRRLRILTDSKQSRSQFAIIIVFFFSQPTHIRTKSNKNTNTNK